MIRSYDCHLSSGRVEVIHYFSNDTVVMWIGGDAFLAPESSNIIHMLRDTDPDRVAAEISRCMRVERLEGDRVRVTLSRGYVSDDSVWGPFGGWSTWDPDLLECHVIPRGFVEPIAKLEAVRLSSGRYKISAYTFAGCSDIDGPVFRDDLTEIPEVCREAERCFAAYLRTVSLFDL